jgi:mycothiol synthase
VEVDRDDVRSSWARPSFDPASDAVIVMQGSRPVGWAEVYRPGRAEADVHPEHRGRGIGVALLGWTEARAREARADSVGQSVTDHNLGAAELFRVNGYQPLWTSWLLRIEMGGDPPVSETPEAISIRPYRPDDDREVFGVIEGAFSEWPHREPETFDDWRAWMIGHDAFTPDRSRVAVTDHHIVGVALALDYGPQNEGWVHQLAVDADHRHRGIARALLLDVFASFQERGSRECGLGTDSRTGALGLYEKVGMRVRRSYTHWTKRSD